MASGLFYGTLGRALLNMIKEYALDPSLLRNWKDLRYFLETMGVTQGRLIARYPKRWKALVYEGLSEEIGDVERKRIEERLSTVNEKLFPRRGRWDDQVSWLENAEAEHSRAPFAGIVSLNNPRSNPSVLLGDEVHEGSEAWAATTQIEVRRDPKVMADSVAPLLRNSQEIVFIDPHFSLTARYTSTLAAFLKVVAQGGLTMRRIQYLCKASGDPGPFIRNCMVVLPRYVRKELTLEVILLKEEPGGEKLHDRFILTDRWGVQFSIGLDSHIKDQATNTIVSLLSDELWSSIYRKYVSDQRMFEQVGAPIRIRGIA